MLGIQFVMNSIPFYIIQITKVFNLLIFPNIQTLFKNYCDNFYKLLDNYHKFYYNSQINKNEQRVITTNYSLYFQKSKLIIYYLYDYRQQQFIGKLVRFIRL